MSKAILPGYTSILYKHKNASNAIYLRIGILVVILACLTLASLGFIQTIVENYGELHTEQWASLWGYI